MITIGASVGARAFATLVAVLVVVAPGAARATGGMSVALDYQTDPALAECPSASAFRADITRQLGEDPVRQVARHRLVVRLFASGARLEGRVEWRDASDQWEGERTFSSRSDSCAQLVRAMALATAIQLQLLVATDAGSAPPPSPPPPPAVATVERAPAAVPPPPPKPAGEPAQRLVSGPAPAPRESLLAVDVGVGALHDFGDGPTFVIPRIALSVGLPWAVGLRLAASGLGPGAQITRPEGVARIDRLVITLALVRFFRAGRIVQPLFAAGAGVQTVHAQGTSATPDLAPARQGRVSSGLITASGGLAFAIRPRLSLVVEVELLLFQPSVTVDVGNSKAAYLDGTALFAHGGLLARF
ncbi:MAG TPA: hypothetical protein VGP07_13045 [Polyangia bacterium]|jgi:hypothetical protein